MRSFIFFLLFWCGVRRVCKMTRSSTTLKNCNARTKAQKPHKSICPRTTLDLPKPCQAKSSQANSQFGTALRLFFFFLFVLLFSLPVAPYTLQHTRRMAHTCHIPISQWRMPPLTEPDGILCCVHPKHPELYILRQSKPYIFNAFMSPFMESAFCCRRHTHTRSLTLRPQQKRSDRKVANKIE